MERETKLHYKMRKVKKRWVTVAIATVALPMSLLLAPSASADDSVAATNQTSLTSNQSNQVAVTTTNNQASSVVETTANAVSTQSNQDYLEVGDSVDIAVTPDNSVQTSDAVSSNDKVQVQTSAVRTQVNRMVPTNTATTAATRQAQAQPKVVKTEVSRLVATRPDFKNTGTNLNNLNLKNSVVQPQENNFAKNNQAYSNQAESFETVDNYLTADSWYRPKAILKDGKTWTASSESDFRPVLMSWWPDTATKTAYVNFWAKEGLISNQAARNIDTAVQSIQTAIEKKISTEGNTAWLRSKMTQFVQSQSQWNINSENPTSYPSQDHLQGGALLFSNSDATAQANSNWRLLNRNPSQQDGHVNYHKSSYGGYELLLANDVDNSNPIVQAEQLNHFHYLMNWGEIVMGDKDANFDGVRVDAVDNVDVDLLQIQRDYYKAKYGTDKSEKNAIDHLSILEAWSGNDNDYVKDQNNFSLSIDNDQRSGMLKAFGYASAYRGNLGNLATAGLKKRSNTSSGDPIPNYVFIRAHDSEVQTRIATVIRERLGMGNVDGLTNITLDDLEKAFAIYNQDMYSVDKQYYINNLPMAYTWMLQNKDTVTRVYYGDMYTDNGQYMATKTPFYNAIETMLKARIKYVAGGQQAGYNQGWNGGILTSVRYGKGADSVTDRGTSETRTSGMAVLINNMPNFQASSGVTLSMGAAHKNQAYRPLLLSTKDGIATYLNDRDVSSSQYKYTDSQGRLSFSASELRSVANVQVSGMIQVWVPVGAADNQDVRTAPSTAKTTDGNIYHQTDALDSQVIYEGFSNFQAFAKTPEQYTNAVIAKNADLFKSWGITQFEMAPQYVSSEDGTFLDSIILNGYAFSDRYDLAMSKNNKYGSKEDLANAIKALHAAGIKVLSDWVPDQMYNLPGKEVVTATRVNQYGQTTARAAINKTPYVVNTRTYGDYQEQYGGKFLDELQKLYPSLFTTKQISTGKAIDPSVKITNWSAKYFNGSNILGRGAKYVLSDGKQYFNLTSGKLYLPTALLSNATTTTQPSTPSQPTQPSKPSTKSAGISYDGKGYIYRLATGQRVKDSLVTDKGNLYYFGKTGYMATGMQKVKGATYYFGKDGKALKNGIYTDAAGKSYYFNNDGKRLENGYYSFGVDKWRHFENGVMAVGLTKVKGKANTYTQYYDAQGIQVKGDFVTGEDGKVRYFDKKYGNMVTNQFITNSKGQRSFFTWNGTRYENGYYQFGDKWRHFTNGIMDVGLTQVKGKYKTYTQFYDPQGIQVKGGFVKDNNGKLRYFDEKYGNMVSNQFIKNSDGERFYFGNDGVAVTGHRVIDGKSYYFNDKGVLIKKYSNDSTSYRPAYRPRYINRFHSGWFGIWF
ncbi:glycoside hydrolase family 70 protein [Streptococcus sobrinus]|uniref:glycoside hydrolase family 70 protein n=8 Tax=Streptococcus sobrinus TaxID=1310 RepID=UPI0002E221FE|nr:glycoside hydrolase family 70 protein [Streptococcus sobrinus]OZV23780.1 glucosyl transferase [Streptococcus sobrinus]